LTAGFAIAEGIPLKSSAFFATIHAQFTSVGVQALACLAAGTESEQAEA
jgi:hypothetical protein